VFAVPEEVAAPSEVKNQQGIMIVLSEADRVSDYSQSISGKSSSNVKRHSTMRCDPMSSFSLLDSALTESGGQNVSAADLRGNNAASTTDRKLPQRTTTRRRRTSRKSTRRTWQRIPDTEINEFDDDDNDIVADDVEEMEFSETDSEPNGDDLASGSDESDLEFETELARRMTASQVQN